MQIGHESKLRSDAFLGVLLGTAVGDAIGLPREGLSRRRAQKLFGGPPLRHRLVFGWGLCSDDTEHSCMVANALIASNGDPERFAKSLAWKLRWWILGSPAGVGLATAKACFKLWLGFSPRSSGVWSAGNGPAMRAAILGVYAADDLSLLRKLVTASTRVTHTDPAAEHGALAIALAAAYAVNVRRAEAPVNAINYLSFVRPHLEGTPMFELLRAVGDSVSAGRPMSTYLEDRKLNRGVSGWVNHTVPVCMYAWLHNPANFRSAVEQVVVAGGDADSTGAIAGALAGISVGHGSIPREWIDGLCEWPRTVHYMRSLARTLSAEQSSDQAGQLPTVGFVAGSLLRNIMFLAIVLFHGVRRLLPPY